ncbi:unnamed protein product, partial [Closterium sp. NIES-64]
FEGPIDVFGFPTYLRFQAPQLVFYHSTPPPPKFSFLQRKAGGSSGEHELGAAAVHNAQRTGQQHRRAGEPGLLLSRLTQKPSPPSLLPFPPSPPPPKFPFLQRKAGANTSLVLLLYITPSAPGSSIVVQVNLVRPGDGKKLPSVPRWLRHIGLHQIYDGECCTSACTRRFLLLHCQERVLQEREQQMEEARASKGEARQGGGAAEGGRSEAGGAGVVRGSAWRAFYMPTNADPPCGGLPAMALQICSASVHHQPDLMHVIHLSTTSFPLSTTYSPCPQLLPLPLSTTYSPLSTTSFRPQPPPPCPQPSSPCPQPPSPLSTTSSPLSTTSFPLSTTSSPLSTTSFPLSTTSSPLSTTSFPCPQPPPPCPQPPPPCPQPPSPCPQPPPPCPQPPSPCPQPPPPVHNLLPPVHNLLPPVHNLLPLSTTSFPLSITSFPLSTTSSPLSTTSFPLSTTSFPLSTTSFPLSTTSFPCPQPPSPCAQPPSHVHQVEPWSTHRPSQQQRWKKEQEQQQVFRRLEIRQNHPHDGSAWRLKGEVGACRMDEERAGGWEERMQVKQEEHYDVGVQWDVIKVH